MQVNTLRFSCIVDPRGIRPGNVVSSKEVVNASLESVGQGDVIGWGSPLGKQTAHPAACRAGATTKC